MLDPRPETPFSTPSVGSPWSLLGLMIPGVVGMRGEMERGEVVATVGGRPAIGIRWRAGFGCGGEGVEKGG